MEPIDRFNADVEYHIEKITDRQNLPQEVAKEATEFYLNFVTQDYAWSRSEEVFASAAVYYCIRKYNLAYTLSDLEADNNQVSRAFRQMCSENDDLPQNQDPEVFVDRIHGSMTGVADRVAEKAKAIIEASDDIIVSRKQPNTIAASAYYLAAKLENIKITQKLIGDTVGVSTVAIRNAYKDLEEV